MRRRDRPREIETPGPGQESVWDYPRPPRVEPVEESVRVEHAGEVVAETDRALRVLETAGAPVYYIPPDDVYATLERSGGRSLCEWKGRAVYWNLHVGGEVVEEAAWSYPEPTPRYREIADHVAFYARKVDACTVGEERATPQPGGFYGGWVTSKVVGPFKGEPGTEAW